MLEKYCHEVKDKAEAQKELDQACKDIETVKEERDVARKERTEAIIQRDHLLREYYQARQVLQVFTDAFFFLSLVRSVTCKRLKSGHIGSLPSFPQVTLKYKHMHVCSSRHTDRNSCWEEMLLCFILRFCL